MGGSVTLVLVEGESDRIAIETLAARRGMRVDVLAIGGAQAARRVTAARAGESMVGLVDAKERGELERVLETVFVCDRDLEDELIRALGVDRVLEVLDQHGELASFGRLQHQPAQRERSTTDQLRRFLAGRSGNKLRYASILVEALDDDRVPVPLEGVLAAAGVPR